MILLSTTVPLLALVIHQVNPTFDILHHADADIASSSFFQVSFNEDLLDRDERYYGPEYYDGLVGPQERTGLANFADNLGDALTSAGKGLGGLL